MGKYADVNVNVDERLLGNERPTFPSIGYSAKRGTFFVSADVTVSGDLPDGMQLDAQGENYETKRLMLVPLAVRKRLVATADDGTVRFYPLFTRRSEMIGAVKRHIQVLCKIPGIDDVMLFGMRGMTSCASWDNPAHGKRLHEFGPGAEAMLEEEIAEARKDGVHLPLFAFRLVLEPLEPRAVGQGRNKSEARPFTVARLDFLGAELTERYAALAMEIDVLSWRAEWDDLAALSAEAEQETEAPQQQPDEVEDDDIPF